MAGLSLHVDDAAVAAAAAAFRPCVALLDFTHQRNYQHLHGLFVEHLAPSFIGPPTFHDFLGVGDGLRSDSVEGPIGDERIGSCSGSSGALCCGNEGLDSSGLERRTRGVEDMVEWLRNVAVDRSDGMVVEDCGMEEMALRARRCLFLRLDSATKKLVFSASKNTGKRSSEELCKNDAENIDFAETVNQHKRRSERLVQNVNHNLSHHLLSRRKRVGIGPTFQADIPQSTCQPDEQNGSDSKKDWIDLRYLGHRVWPVEGNDMNINEVVVGKGRHDSCVCSFPGSASCIDSHVKAATLQLKAALGHAFFNWGFDRMGEQVAASWTADEQMKFGSLERLETSRECGNFWEIAEKYFCFKSKGQLISYYFNVFLLRRIRNLSRLAPEYVDTNEEDDNIIQYINEKRNERVRGRKKGKSLKRYSITSS